MANTDDRRLKRTTTPGIYRRHAGSCPGRRCRCPYVVRYKDRDGASRKQLFATLEVAREFKRGLGGKASRRPPSAVTVAEHFPAWLERYRGRTKRGLEETTRREYETSWRLHIAPAPLARIRLRDVTAPDITEWFGWLEKRDTSPNTIRKARAALAVMLADARQAGLIGADPIAGVRYVPSAATQRKHARPPRHELTADDVARILAALEPRWQTFFLVLTQTGARISELLGLRWEHVHLDDDPHLTIVEQLYERQRKRLKTEASRGRVPLSSAAASALLDLRLPEAGKDAPVFCSTVGTPLSYANLYNRVLTPALRDTGLDGQGIAFHAFRKTCGSLLFARGKTLKQVQGWLRHSQLTTTMNVYINQVDDGLGDASVWDNVLPSGGPLGGPSEADQISEVRD